MTPFYRFAFSVVKPLAFLFFRLRLIGRENIPESGALMLCANHRSYCDPVFVGVGLKRQVHFMAYDKLFHGWFGKLITALGAFPVNRESTGHQVGAAAPSTCWKTGRSWVFFPGRTRSKDGTLLKAKAGAVMIAYRANCPILPAAIVAKGKVRPFKKHTVRYGKPVHSSGAGDHHRLGHGDPGRQPGADAPHRRADGGRILSITVAKTAGFCFGVNRAVNLVYELLNEGKRVVTLGPIIHNPSWWRNWNAGVCVS